MSDFRYYRPNNFPPLVKNLIIINVLVWIAQLIFDKQGSDLTGKLALYPVQHPYFEPYQIATHMFTHHPTMIFHLAFNMFGLWMFGRILENVWGPKKFLTFYVLSGLGAALLHLTVLYFEYTPFWEAYGALSPSDQAYLHYSHTVGASGAVFGCLAAFGYLFPNSLIYVYFLVPIKAKWFVMIYAGMELFLGVRNSAGDNVAHWAHLGGALVGFLLVLYWNRTNRRRFY